MSFLDLQNDFYRPLWIRVVLLVIMFTWSVFEFVTGAPFWGVIFGGVGVVALWQWFFDGWPGHEFTATDTSAEKGREPSDTTADTNSRKDPRNHE